MTPDLNETREPRAEDQAVQALPCRCGHAEHYHTWHAAHGNLSMTAGCAHATALPRESMDEVYVRFDRCECRQYEPNRDDAPRILYVMDGSGFRVATHDEVSARLAWRSPDAGDAR